MSKNIDPSLDQSRRNHSQDVKPTGMRKMPSSVHGYKAIDMGQGHAQTFIKDASASSLPKVPPALPAAQDKAKHAADAVLPLESKPKITSQPQEDRDLSDDPTQLGLSPILANDDKHATDAVLPLGSKPKITSEPQEDRDLSDDPTQLGLSPIPSDDDKGPKSSTQNTAATVVGGLSLNAAKDSSSASAPATTGDDAHLAAPASPIDSDPTFILDIIENDDQSEAPTQIGLSPISPDASKGPQSSTQNTAATVVGAPSPSALLASASTLDSQASDEASKDADKPKDSKELSNTVLLPDFEEVIERKTQHLMRPLNNGPRHSLIRLTPEQKRSNPILKQISEGTSKTPIHFEHDENRWDSNQFPLPEIGQTIGDYRILSLVGKGGFGAVFSAKNLNIGRVEAIKLILPSAKEEVTDIDKRFLREIDIASRLEHPNIVRLYRSGIYKQKVMWMSMELINGQGLDDIIVKSKGLSLARAKRLILQILDGLILAHKSQIVHRDLKPANIIVSQFGRTQDHITILDFGLAKAFGPNEDIQVQDLTMQHKFRVYGTPQYMAPEQVLKGILGPWTDVYATGLILYELLTGEPAVTGDSHIDIAMSQAYGHFELPKALQNTPIGDVITKACAKKAQDRYADAGAFYDALESIETPLALSKNSKTPTLKTGLKTLTADDVFKGTKAKTSVFLILYLLLASLLSIAFIAACVAWTLSYLKIAF